MLSPIISAPAGARVNSPSWSPDGKKIAYTEISGNKTRLMISGAGVGRPKTSFRFLPPGSRLIRLLYTGDGKIFIDNARQAKPRRSHFRPNFN